ncbi:PhoH family protein [Ilyobacter sp.]|uniref:PhoH family protein n=1 Tax=Ilyobacter sp. TaxID=3100343 RepID=UPI003565458C
MANYVVDTNIIIANPFFLREFNECTILIPIYVLEELDKLKSREGNSGFRARQFLRNFKDIEEKGSLLQGIELKNGVILKSTLEKPAVELPENFDVNYVDNKILSIMLADAHRDDILLTNDVSMRIKASSMGIKCRHMDMSDKHKLDDLYNGVLEIKVSEENVKKFYSENGIDPKELGIEVIYPNQFFMGYTDYSYSKIIGRYDSEKEKIIKLHNEDYTVFGVKAKDVRQKFALEALLNPKIPFVSITSRQGCGKTLLALAAALEQVIEQSIYSKVIIGKNTSPIDKWNYQGFTTGATEEKLLTHFGNYTTTLENLQNIRGKKSRSGADMLNALINQEKLEILDISSILGSSFIDKIVIIDEAQSFDAHAIRSIITRIGENCKLILIGDIAQQTISRLDPDKSGLYVAIEWLKEIPETAHVTLDRVHRSTFVDKASRIFDKKMFG